MHRDDRPPRHRPRRHSAGHAGAGDGMSGSLLFGQPDAEPRDLTPRRTKVTIAPLPPRRPRRRWLHGYKIHALDVTAAVLGLLLLLVIFWPHH